MRNTANYNLNEATCNSYKTDCSRGTTDSLELDPPRNHHHHLFHFTLPHNKPSSHSHHHHQHDLFFFGTLDSPPPQHSHFHSLPNKSSFVSPTSAKETPTRPPRKTAASSRTGKRGRRVRGEVIEVQGGHIVRSTGRKDRHSKVCTAKGPRDRRVRLSAPTAIQFYDVQDRLGYDRPSKAVDWLIKKAKAAIDELAHLPSWKPTATAAASPDAAINTAATPQQETMINFHLNAAMDQEEGDGLGNMLCQHRQMDDEFDKRNNDPAACSSFQPSSLNSENVADTMKSFPMGVSSDHLIDTSPSMQFHGYSPDLILRTNSQSQDLRLSLQSFQEQPLMLQPRHPQTHKHQQVVLPGTPPHHRNQLVLDGYSSTSSAASLWLSDHNRISHWNSSGGDAGISTAGGSGGFMFGSLAVAPTPMPMPTPYGLQGQFFQQRGPLQSSNLASVRGWIDSTMAIATNDHHPVMPGDIPARIRGQGEEMQEGILDRPSSTSSDSHSRH